MLDLNPICALPLSDRALADVLEEVRVNADAAVEYQRWVEYHDTTHKYAALWAAVAAAWVGLVLLTT
jgi:hypothetical protein